MKFEWKIDLIVNIETLLIVKCILYFYSICEEKLQKRVGYSGTIGLLDAIEEKVLLLIHLC